MTSKKIDLVLILFILFYILPVNSLKAYQRKTQGIDIRSFGAKDDGRTNILTALENASRKAQKEGTFVFIPKTNSSKGYYIDGNAKIYSSISSDGATITAPSKYNKILFLQSSGITIENLKFSIANDQLLVNAPIAIEINGMDNVKFHNFEF